MSSANSVFGSSFNEGFDFQGFSSGAMENHNCHSYSRSRERSPHERSSRTTTWKRKDELKENRPENVQDCHHCPHLPHLVPREAERLLASQAEVLKIHNRILLQAEIHLAEVNATMQKSGSNGSNYSSPIDNWQPTRNSVLDRRIDCLENAIK